MKRQLRKHMVICFLQAAECMITLYAADPEAPSWANAGTILAIALAAQLPAIVLALSAYLRGLKAGVTLEEVRKALNGRLDDLLASKSSEWFQRGIHEGRRQKWEERKAKEGQQEKPGPIEPPDKGP